MREAIRIVSVNVGQAETILHGGKSHRTGIRKRPLAGPIELDEKGLKGDSVVDTRHHGGPDQAVYVYRTEDYEWWVSQTGRDFPHGVFGENLTITGLPGNLFIGDRLLIGDVLLEATSARIPCGTLAAAMADPGFGMAFRRAERPGVYFRVLNPGIVCSGDSVTVIESEHGSVTVLDLFRFAYQTSHDVDELRRFLDAPVAERVRAQLTSALDALADAQE
ncbi:MAG: MOSC domain-containing protein [Gammaproteobacteria bacterium]|nr:MOSC domain-containing protein [Gammaproteobacteria bacterium]